ncbi:hypothetical protein [Anaeromyxobacter oryzae]|uniref:Flagellar hook-length control protein-like C-terminal domain-containing protein n=1 Tax=Anaeromyxobacter oryzae TaxID=2918170 RepID=A0ABM7WR55_9BACT|nr:hypothetical protein [Anaeromyxobacter oryzae]BDG01952.1 hypothetical protein AMOR_09480 [Anaeromyxobacter oryzae]
MPAIHRATPPARERDATPARRAASRFAEALRSARRAAAGGSRAQAVRAGSPARRTTPATVDGERRASGSSEEAARGACEVAQQRSTADVQATASVDALRAGVRALPAAVEAARVAGGDRVALAFGSALGVDLRGGAAGLELTLRPAAALERAARAELPGLVAALRARGIRVARATVRSRDAITDAGDRPGTGRVDAAPGLR